MTKDKKSKIDPNLEVRRIRGDTIMMYKCLTEKERLTHQICFIRGNQTLPGHKMKQRKRKRDMYKNNFLDTVMDLRPQEVACENDLTKLKENMITDYKKAGYYDLHSIL